MDSSGNLPKADLPRSSLASTPSPRPEHSTSRASSRSSNSSPPSVAFEEKGFSLKRKFEENTEPLKRNSFSIQSILAKPAPLRPAENPVSYAQMLQANFFGFPGMKYPPQGLMFPWPHRPNNNEMPENLSMKGFTPLNHKQPSESQKTSHQPKPACTEKTAPPVTKCGRESPSAGSRSPSPCPSFEEDDEPGKSPSSANDSSRRKKTRTVFSRNQVFQLESMFDMKRYLSSSERASLAASLNLSEQQIKIWFQNRRNKWKRQLCSDLGATTMTTVGAHGGHRFPPHPHLSLPMYAFPSALNGENPSQSMSNLFCPNGAVHPLFMGASHLPFPRPTV